jgi:2-dehydro-3-deoxygluconokinase
MRDLVTFGVATIRLSPAGGRRLEQATALELTAGGAALNVASGVAKLGLSTALVSCLPDNPLGRIVRNKALEFGVDVSGIAWDRAGRMGLSFDQGATWPELGGVLYDMSGSAMAELRDVRFDWVSVFAECRAYHTTGTTTALSDRAAAEVGTSLAAARAAGLLTSYDLSYQAQLWRPERAREIQKPMLGLVDVLIVTAEDTRTVFGIVATDYRDVARRLAESYGFKVVAITLRSGHGATRTALTSIAFANETFFDDRTYEVEIVDRVGGNDAYAAGFLYGMLTDGVAAGVRYGNALSALNQSHWGDLDYTTEDEVTALLREKGPAIIG